MATSGVRPVAATAMAPMRACAETPDKRSSPASFAAHSPTSKGARPSIVSRVVSLSSSMA